MRRYLWIIPLLLAMAWTPSAQAAPCAATDLSVLLNGGTTCDIGSLEYTFQGVNNPAGVAGWSFTPLANGFTIAYTLGSITLNGVPNNVTENGPFEVDYRVVALGGAAITDVGITCGTLVVAGTATGGFASASCKDVFLNLGDAGLTPQYKVTDTSGVQTTVNVPTVSCVPHSPGDCSGGSGQLIVYDLLAQGVGYSASYDPSTTVTSNATVPEPNSFFLLGTGLAALLGMARRKGKSFRFRTAGFAAVVR
jgi:hypothetical protein